ncbi:MAG: Gfo/Idh/MocA family oxidoreductase [Leptospiraceae bacterium]|nr:Gfo/Idh/MocA family oxidoreductase [Leptospiraceae bacterium]MCK6381730.1 Gfo/Idh/MocA family oxidoreductase [Leptospiraceae bacterium]
MKTLILGLGRISYLLEKDTYRTHPCTHSGVLYSKFGKQRFELTGIYDTQTEKIKDFSKYWKIQSRKIISDLKEIQNSMFDLCIIASSSISHYENAIFAIQKNIQHILIEKPVCLNLDELKKIYSLSKKKNINIWVNHERRHHPVYSKVRKLYLENQLGKIKTIKASVLTNSNNDPTSSYIGHLLHDGTHAVDYIHWLIGSPQKIESKYWVRSKKSNYAERIIAMFQYLNGEIVFLEVGGGRKYFQFEIDIETTSNRIVLSNDGHRFYEIGKSTLYKNFYSLFPAKNPVKSHSNPWIILYDEIYKKATGKIETITGSLKDNLEIMEILETIRKNGKRQIINF